jgi:hypothetical protein
LDDNIIFRKKINNQAIEIHDNIIQILWKNLLSVQEDPHLVFVAFRITNYIKYKKSAGNRHTLLRYFEIYFGIIPGSW